MKTNWYDKTSSSFERRITTSKKIFRELGINSLSFSKEVKKND